MGCSNTKSGVNSNPSQSSSSTIKYTEFAESRPSRANFASRVDALVRQVERSCQIFDAPVPDLGFARISCRQTNSPRTRCEGRSLTALTLAGKGRVASAKQRGVDENEGAWGADFEKTGLHQSLRGAMT